LLLELPHFKGVTKCKINSPALRPLPRIKTDANFILFLNSHDTRVKMKKMMTGILKNKLPASFQGNS
jgi:hypothetical protein